MKRWEIRRHFQETRPFDMRHFLIILMEKLTEKGIISDEEFIQMLTDQQLLAENIPHYE
ncbi:MAG: hypothetical protein JO029_13330 [Candidatus Eremiobacteraeota bacterium]|nr:hypothetical protein [Candidatus Eremiobacteraeota bacterium]MBV8284179.1 hypothetical protein [Candidatus Eremiobacteraeota bacterium]MBV8332538.1 hypothetical protein [Candidatus Eremiobacteraeota bacterium]MBV8435255.1 hypothetical protein [Candidatus Eremiobacteraeota bacterium]MBV8721344.1 hypothetical protein [Candidatus Eremiobacteraeota bacterium]